MSEFTEGILFLNQHTEEMQQIAQIFHIKKFVNEFIEHWKKSNARASSLLRNRFADRKRIEYMIHRVNDKWSALLIEDYVFNLKYKPIYEWLQQVSEKFPVLVFHNTEDYGWGFTLFDSGNAVAKVDVNYELDWNMVYVLLEQEFPELAGKTDALFNRSNIQDYYKKVRESQEYQDAIDEMFRNLNAETFSAFGMPDADIKRLKSEITPFSYRDKLFEQVEKFKKLVGIEGMDYMSCRYLHDQDEGE